YLYSGTLASNLRFGADDVGDGELWVGLRIAQDDEFVAEKENRLEERVAQGGKNYSGGQRKRQCIDRATTVTPQIYVFYDSFSDLDVATDSGLLAALNESTGQATYIVVAQRVSTIREADQIIVHDAGRIVGRGTLEELAETNPTYREIVESQLTTEEVN